MMMIALHNLPFKKILFLFCTASCTPCAGRSIASHTAVILVLLLLFSSSCFDNNAFCGRLHDSTSVTEQPFIVCSRYLWPEQLSVDAREHRCIDYLVFFCPPNGLLPRVHLVLPICKNRCAEQLPDATTSLSTPISQGFRSAQGGSTAARLATNIKHSESRFFHAPTRAISSAQQDTSDRRVGYAQKFGVSGSRLQPHPPVGEFAPSEQRESPNCWPLE